MGQTTVNVVTRLGEEGLGDIYDLSTCLSAQTNNDFKWIILLRPSAHKYFSEICKSLQFDHILWNQITLIKCFTDNRSKLLNRALDILHDGYLVVLDDDDLPLSHFIETINEAAQKVHCKSIIRTQVVQMETLRQKIGNRSIQISMSPMKYLWPSEFNRLSHLTANKSPCMGISYPVKLLNKFGLNWDEKIEAVEDWDMLMRASNQIPVMSAEEVTAVYRRSGRSYRSQKAISPLDWQKSEEIVRRKIQTQTFKLTGAEVISLSTKNDGFNTNPAPYRVKLFVGFVRFIQPRLINTPFVYNLLKFQYKRVAKMLKVDDYV